MTKQAIIDKTVKILNKLPSDKAKEISDFADFIDKRFDAQNIINDIQTVISEGQSFYFLNDEEDIYSEEDLKVKYND